MTLPLLPRTLPKRTATNSVSLFLFMCWIASSATRLLAPMIFVD